MVEFGTQDTGAAYIQMRLPLARGPLDPLTTAILDEPPGRAALAPPGRLKRVLNKAHHSHRNPALEVHSMHPEGNKPICQSSPSASRWA
jgi:hypothetical protein